MKYFKQMISYIIYHILYITYICLLVFMKYFKQMISYIIEGDLIYVYIHIYFCFVYIRTSLFCISIFFHIYIILTLKYMNMILLSIFLFCLYSYFFPLYVHYSQHSLLKYMCILLSVLVIKPSYNKVLLNNSSWIKIIE